MQFQLITPEKIYFTGEASMVTIPGADGMFGVMSGHKPFISTLKPGVITIEPIEGDIRKVLVLSGIAEVTPERCQVLAEVAQDCSEVTPADAAKSLSDAQALIADAATDAEKKHAKHQLALAQALVSSF